MPIVRITTNATKDVRDRVAFAITGEFLTLDIVESHIATLFQTATTDDLYEASRPLSQTAGDVGFALVQVGMTASRPDAVRDGIARAIADAFAPEIDPTRVSIDFMPREAYDVYVGAQAMGRRRAPAPENPGVAQATQTSPADSPVTEVELREALFALDWKSEVLTADGDTLLEALLPEWMRSWDSLAAIGTAEGLESELNLPRGTLERGQVEFSQAFGADARIRDLAAYVAGRNDTP